MAKPGRGAKQLQAAQMAGAADLARARMSDDEVRDVQERMELANGLRCNGCGKRIAQGFVFVSMAPREQSPLIRLAACARDECDYGLKCRMGATYMEIVEYVWLDEAGIDAPPAKVIAEVAAKRKAREDAQTPEQREAVEAAAGEKTSDKGVILPGDPS